MCFFPATFLSNDYFCISFLISAKSDCQTVLHCNPLLSPFHDPYVVLYLIFLNISKIEVIFEEEAIIMLVLWCVYLLGQCYLLSDNGSKNYSVSLL